MAITVLLDGLPVRTMEQAVFDAAMAQLMTDLPTWAGQVNATAALMTSAIAGGAMSLPYTFSTTTTDADPGAGTLRLSGATQNTSTVIRLDLAGADGTTWTSVIDTFDDSTSAIKGHILLQKVADASKWLLFSVSSLASPSGYKNITVTPVASSAASPFANGDSLILKFSRTGDVGTAGTIVRRTTAITTASAPTPDASNTDMYVVSALAEAPTFGAPAGSPATGQGLIIRVKDNGTARLLAFNSIYRASSDLPMPTTTIINKTLYMGFVYNSADTKWDLVSALNNI